MDKKNLLKRLIEVFTSEEVIETSFVDVKTADGRILRVAEMAIDKEVKEITADGEIDLEDGEYQLEDETIIKVEGGLIKELSIKEEETEDEIVEEQMSEEVVEDLTEEVISEEAIETPIDTEDNVEVDELIENIKSLIKDVAELKGEFSTLVEENKELKLEVEKFSKTPSAEPTKVKVDFKKENKNESIMYSILTKNKK
jgi:hypothetical protein